MKGLKITVTEKRLGDELPKGASSASRGGGPSCSTGGNCGGGGACKGVVSRKN
jgi:hypothetical protein